MKITFLGVWMVPEDGETVSFVVELGANTKILVDSGVNTVSSLVRAGIDPCSITHMLITHSHGDHIAGIPLYLFYRYKYCALTKKEPLLPLKVITTADAWEAVKNYVNIPYPNLADDPHLVIDEFVDDGAQLNIGDDYKMSCFFTNHRPVTFGFKLSNDRTGKSIVYSADTSICEAVINMANNTDCLIHDVASDSKYPMLGKAGHGLCKDVGSLAERSQVKMLVPVHRLPLYKEFYDDYESELREGFTGTLVIPSDGDSICI